MGHAAVVPRMRRLNIKVFCVAVKVTVLMPTGASACQLLFIEARFIVAKSCVVHLRLLLFHFLKETGTFPSMQTWAWAVVAIPPTAIIKVDRHTTIDKSWNRGKDGGTVE